MPIPAELDDVRDLFTATEFGLLQASFDETLSAAELTKKRALARGLRDKWRDQYTRQRRAAQQKRGARESLDNDRSHQKHELFVAAVVRYEELIAKNAMAAPESLKPAPVKKPKSSRVKGHRKTRTVVRKQLKQLTKGAPAKPAAAPPAATKPSPPVAAPAAAKAAGKRVKAAAKTPPVKVAPAPAAAKKPARPAKKAPATGRIGATAAAAKSKSAGPAAKKTRIKLSGLNTRVKGHVSGSGKRSQAKRDVRGKR